MNVPAQEHAGENPREASLIDRIPVRNVWLLMLYASRLLRYLDTKDRRAVEESPDDIPDLVAEILTREVSRRIKRNLSFGYWRREAVLRRVRGRIDLLRTERGRLLERAKIACRFEEMTVDTPRNRFVRAALERIAGVVHDRELARECRSLGATLRQLGVAGERPGRGEVSVYRFGRHDTDDRRMVFAAQLAFSLALPSEASGAALPFLPERENKRWIRNLYEKAVAGFYEVVLSGKGWRVRPGETLRWPTEKETPGIRRILPSMKTDIVLEHAGRGRRVVIDTKFTSIVTAGRYREETLRSNYIYQIYAYLRSQEGGGRPFANVSEGILLHPSVGGAMINEAVVIQGHKIRFATVNLAAGAREIRRQLLNVIGDGGSDLT